MGVLGNLDHERFCQALHVRLWSGEKRATALPAAYRASVYQGDAPDAAIHPNARRLAQRSEIKERLAELAGVASQMAGLGASWALLKLRAFAEGTADFTQEEFKHVANEDGELLLAEKKVKVRAYDPIAAHRLMAEIAGWKAPTKVAATDTDGNNVLPCVEISFVKAKP